MHVEFITRRELTPGVWEYRFKPEKPVQYAPGQYARFWFPFDIHDARGKYYRTFSLTSHPSEKTIRFIVRLEQPLSVFKQPLSQLQPGDRMFMDEPHGDAVLPRLDTIPIIFVAQGIALASYISILHDVTQRELAQPISLLWAHREPDAALVALLPPLSVNVRRHDYRSPKRITIADILERDSDATLIYLSGGQAFVESLGKTLEASSVPRERIIYDYYEGYAEL